MSHDVDENLLAAISDLYQAKASFQDEDVVNDDYVKFIGQVVAGVNRRCLTLESLHLGMNVLTKIPKLLRLRPDINAISLFDNVMQDSGLQSLYQILLSNPQIKGVNIGCNDLSDGAMICLMDLVRKTSIDRLQLGCLNSIWQANRFSKGTLCQIVEAMAESDHLRCIGLSGVIATRMKRIADTRQFSSYIGNLIAISKNLSTLDLACLGLCDNDQEALANGFKKNHSLRVLIMEGNSFPYGTKLVEGISKVVTLKSLNLSKCNLGTPALIVIASALKSGWGLIELNLSENRIGSIGVQELFDVLSDNCTLVTLNLASNSFDAAIENKLKKMLSSNEVLAELDLSKNQLGDSAIHVLAEIIPHNTSLIRVALASCRMTDAGILSFAEAVVHNTTLKRAIFRDNFLSHQVGFHLLEILQANETLVWIDLSSNQIDSFAIQAIQRLCQRNRIICKQKKLIPLKKEVIRLSIQKSKIPVMEETLNRMGTQYRDIEEQNIEIEQEIQKLNKDTDSVLKVTTNAIKEFEKMLQEEEAAIEDMTNSIMKMREETEKQTTDVKQQIEVEKLECEKYMAEASKIEAETKEYQTETDKEEQALRAEIARIEAVMEEISAAMTRRKVLRTYKIPSESVIDNKPELEPLELPPMEEPVTKKKSARLSQRSGRLSSARRKSALAKPAVKLRQPRTIL